MVALLTLLPLRVCFGQPIAFSRNHSGPLRLLVRLLGSAARSDRHATQLTEVVAGRTVPYGGGNVGVGIDIGECPGRRLVVVRSSNSGSSSGWWQRRKARSSNQQQRVLSSQLHQPHLDRLSSSLATTPFSRALRQMPDPQLERPQARGYGFSHEPRTPRS
ncbi:hypothetical protein ACQY0O_003663 [Thecaphora frezii]